MKLVAGLGSLDDLTAYATAGADEVFIGYVPMRWQEKYGLTTPLNRREVCFYNVQIGSFSELRILSELAKKNGVKVTVAFNGLNFREDQYPLIASIMEECLSVGISDVIIADLGLLLYLNRMGLNRTDLGRTVLDRTGLNRTDLNRTDLNQTDLNRTGPNRKLTIHISGEFGEINHYLVKELARLGAKRIIFHRKVSLENMEQIIRACKADENMGKDMEFEAFLLNENCHFNGAFCNSLHCDELVPMCRMPYRLGGEGKMPSVKRAEAECTESAEEFQTKGTEDSDDLQSASAFSYDYGLKNLSKMQSIGITHLKIVGRGADSEFMIKCIQKAREKIS